MSYACTQAEAEHSLFAGDESSLAAYASACCDMPLPTRTVGYCRDSGWGPHQSMAREMSATSSSAMLIDRSSRTTARSRVMFLRDAISGINTSQLFTGRHESLVRSLATNAKRLKGQCSLDIRGHGICWEDPAPHAELICKKEKMAVSRVSLLERCGLEVRLDDRKAGS